MKLFLQLAVIAAFAAPVFAQAHDSSMSPTEQTIAKKDKKKKGKKKGGATADPAAAPAEGAGK